MLHSVYACSSFRLKFFIVTGILFSLGLIHLVHSQNFPKHTFSTYAYHGVRNIIFPEIFAYVLKEWSPGNKDSFSPHVASFIMNRNIPDVFCETAMSEIAIVSRPLWGFHDVLGTFGDQSFMIITLTVNEFNLFQNHIG